MQAYWSQDFDIIIGDVQKHPVELYKYSEKCVCLITTKEFGKAFSKYFKNIEGRFNPNLKINDEKKPGWIFKSSEQFLESLNNILKEIYEEKIKPGNVFVKPDFNSSSRNNKVFNLISTLTKQIPEETEEHVISDKDGIKTSIYYNSGEETVTEGELVYRFDGGKKSVEIYQLVDKE